MVATQPNISALRRDTAMEIVIYCGLSLVGPDEEERRRAVNLGWMIEDCIDMGVQVIVSAFRDAG